MTSREPDFERGLRAIPLFNILLTRHPELNEPLIGAFRRHWGQPNGSFLASREMAGIVDPYVRYYASIAPDVAASMFATALVDMLSAIEKKNPALCKAIIEGKEPLPVDLVNDRLGKQLVSAAFEVVQQAVHLPRPRPSREWTNGTLARLAADSKGPATVFHLLHSDCRTLRATYDHARDELNSSEFFRLVRGVLYTWSEGLGDPT